MKLDIGCGPKCLPEFVGVDRFSLPGVMVVADLDTSLPFEDDSVDLVHAAHSLEHVSDLMFTMRELYRVCKHKAQICIVAPYFEQKLNLANPYHLQVFNEHTPRFWTSFPWAPIDEREYYHPHAAPWGLSESDHSNPGLDIRLLRMEFFYFPRFNRLELACQRELRQNLTDVCHQVVYHLVVWKDKSDDDYIELTKHLDVYPFLDTPALQKAREDSLTHEDEGSHALIAAERQFRETLEVELRVEQYGQFNQQLKSQYDHIVACEKHILKNEKLITLLAGKLELPDNQLRRFNDYLSANYRRVESNKLSLSEKLFDEGYTEYPIASKGFYNSVSVCVYLSGDSVTAKLGVEVVGKDNSIVWNSVESLSSVRGIGVVSFSLMAPLKQENVASIRIFGRDLDIAVQIVECSVTSLWPFSGRKKVPYVCFTNDE